MSYIVTDDGVPLFYEDQGPRSSSGIFLLHAEPFNTKFWQKNIPVLSRQFRVVSMDVRGRGESGKTDDGHSLAQYAADMRFMLERLGLEKVVAVGWSMGGAIIWSYVRQYGKDRLAGFVDVDQRPYGVLGSYEDFQGYLAIMRSSRLEHHRRSVLNYFGPEVNVDEALVDWMAYECMKVPTAAHIAAAWDAHFSDFRPVLATMGVSARIFWARYGGIDTDMAKFLEQSIPNSKAVFFGHSGHLLPWTEAEKFNRELAGFAREVL